MITVRLDQHEAFLAYQLGCMRSLESLYGGRKDHYSDMYPGQGIAGHLNGAAGEQAVSKWLGIYNEVSLNRFGEPDFLSCKLEVRWAAKGELKVKPEDPDECMGIACMGFPPVLTITGWYLRMGDAKQKKYLEDRNDKGRPVYFVPIADLKKPESLPSFLREEFDV